MAKKRKIKKGRVVFLLSIIFILLGLIVAGIISLFISLSNNKALTACAHDMTMTQSLDFDVNSSSYIIIKEDEIPRTLYAKDEHERIYPASLTKIMTMMVTLDHTVDINDTLTVTEEDLSGLIEANASVYGLEVGDQISVHDALYGLILESGADCANLLRRYIEDQGYDFISLMNEKAASLGMRDSHFANVTGLDDEENYTTVYDMALLLHEALQNDNAQAVLTTMYYESPDGYDFESTLSPLESYNSEEARALGGKTGFTYIAHLTIATVIEDERNDTYLVVMANASEDGDDGRRAHIEDVHDIMENLIVRW